MPKQRNKAHHLQQIASSAEAIEHAHRTQVVAIVQARLAGATWSEVAAMMPRTIGASVKSKQHAQQAFHAYRYDAVTDELIEDRPMFGR